MKSHSEVTGSNTMSYSEVVKSGQVLPKKEKYTMKDANNLLRKKHLTPLEESFLEHHQFINKPTKTYVALVDNLYENIWTDTLEPLPVADCDTFNKPIGKCVMHEPVNNLMWHGEVMEDQQDVPKGYKRYFFKVSKLCEKRLKSVWQVV